MSDKVEWPVVIQYQGQHELTYVESESVWRGDADLHFFAYESGDVVIDSRGAVYDISQSTHSTHQWIATGEHLTKAQVTTLVQHHLSHAGQCCVSKFSVSSIAEAIAVVGLESD